MSWVSNLTFSGNEIDENELLAWGARQITYQWHVVSLANYFYCIIASHRLRFKVTLKCNANCSQGLLNKFAHTNALQTISELKNNWLWDIRMITHEIVCVYVILLQERHSFKQIYLSNVCCTAWKCHWSWPALLYFCKLTSV